MSPQVIFLIKALIPVTTWTLQRVLTQYHPKGILGLALGNIQSLLGELGPMLDSATVATEQAGPQAGAAFHSVTLPPHAARLLEHFPQGHVTQQGLQEYMLALPGPPLDE